MASCRETGRTPGTGFVATRPPNGLTPCVPGMACPGVEGASDCADARPAANNNAPANEIKDRKTKRSLRGTSLARILFSTAKQGGRILIQSMRLGQLASPVLLLR